jgi:RND family efflux transporter MFP subunit
MSVSKRFWLFTFVYLATLTVQTRARSDAGIAAITNPSADVTLSFVQPGRIERIHIKEGDAVKAGQVLAQQDDAVDRARLAQLEADSKNMTNIEAGKASLDQKKVDLQKLEIAAARNAATELEVEHAKLDVKIAELSLELALFEHEQAVRKYEEAKLQIDNMSLKSPIDGRVEKLEVETGESVNALESVVRAVQIDPLWIDVPVPLANASTLACDGAAEVIFQGLGKTTVKGRVIFIAAVADAGSGTLRVRIEVPNKAKRPAGEHVTVVFSTSQEERENSKQ